MDKAQISVIILTYNEEANIQFALKSLKDLTDEVFIVDSFSTDKTLESAREYTDKIYQNSWEGWAPQRNWALANLPISSEWVFFLDADEQVTQEFWDELKQTIYERSSNIAAMNVRFDFFFLGSKLRFAYESPPVLRIIRRFKARWQGVGAREYAVVNGKVATVKSRIIHRDQKDLTVWIAKQTRNADREARLALSDETSLNMEKTDSSTYERSWRRFLRDRVWKYLPTFWRSFAYFFYRYTIRGGFLDGKAGFAYCFLQALWLPLLTEMLIEERKTK